MINFRNSEGKQNTIGDINSLYMIQYKFVTHEKITSRAEPLKL